MVTQFDPFRISKFGIGFDSLINTVQSDFFSDSYHNSYPPYNIIKKDELNYDIAVAVAGFSKNDLEVEYADDILTVKTNSTIDEQEKPEVIHRGIGMRKFTRQWTIADDVIVTSTNLENGLLTISLEKVVPDGKKKRTIEIGTDNDN